MTTPAPQPQYIIPETVFNHVVAALRDNRQYDVAEYLINGATHTIPPAPVPWQLKEAKTLRDKEWFMAGYREGAKAEREQMAKELSGIINHEWMCSLPEILYIIECVSKGNLEPFKETPHPAGADTPAPQPQYIIPETVFNHVVAALRDNRQYDVAEYLINGATHTIPPAPRPPCEECMYQERIDKAAKAEREKVFPFLEELASPSVSDARKREIIQSLQAQQEQP